MKRSQLTRLKTFLDAIDVQLSNFDCDFDIEVETFEHEVTVIFKDEFFFYELQLNNIFDNCMFNSGKTTFSITMNLS